MRKEYILLVTQHRIRCGQRWKLSMAREQLVPIPPASVKDDVLASEAATYAFSAKAWHLEHVLRRSASSRCLSGASKDQCVMEGTAHAPVSSEGSAQLLGIHCRPDDRMRRPQDVRDNDQILRPAFDRCLRRDGPATGD